MHRMSIEYCRLRYDNAIVERDKEWVKHSASLRHELLMTVVADCLDDLVRASKLAVEYAERY